MNTADKIAIVVVQAIEPATANKSGKVLTDKGAFGVWKDKIALFNAGERYEVGYVENYRGNVLYRDVRSVRHIGAAGPNTIRRPAAAPRPARAAAPVRRSNVVPLTQDETPAPESPADYGLQDNRYWTPKPRHPAEQEQIFVAMGLKCDIERGRVSDDEDELVARVELWRRVWARTFGQRAAA